MCFNCRTGIYNLEDALKFGTPVLRCEKCGEEIIPEFDGKDVKLCMKCYILSEDGRNKDEL